MATLVVSPLFGGFFEIPFWVLYLVQSVLLALLLVLVLVVTVERLNTLDDDATEMQEKRISLSICMGAGLVLFMGGLAYLALFLIGNPSEQAVAIVFVFYSCLLLLWFCRRVWVLRTQHSFRVYYNLPLARVRGRTSARDTF